jgi:hypothetical protein
MQFCTFIFSCRVRSSQVHVHPMNQGQCHHLCQNEQLWCHPWWSQCTFCWSSVRPSWRGSHGTKVARFCQLHPLKCTPLLWVNVPTASLKKTWVGPLWVATAHPQCLSWSRYWWYRICIPALVLPQQCLHFLGITLFWCCETKVLENPIHQTPSGRLDRPQRHKCRRHISCAKNPWPHWTRQANTGDFWSGHNIRHWKLDDVATFWSRPKKRWWNVVNSVEVFTTPLGFHHTFRFSTAFLWALKYLHFTWTFTEFCERPFSFIKQGFAQYPPKTQIWLARKITLFLLGRLSINH